MTTVYLTRRQHLEDRTIGVLELPGGVEILTLELPWRENRQNISRIPDGTYRLVRGRHFNLKIETWVIPNYGPGSVEGRTDIKIHPGRRPVNTEGCPLIGLRLGQLDGLPVLEHRSAAQELLMSTLEPYEAEGLDLVVRSVGPPAITAPGDAPEPDNDRPEWAI